jgi:putative hemin transport protein
MTSMSVDEQVVADVEGRGLSLAARWEALREQTSGVRVYDAAKLLGCSELELVATTIGDGAQRLVTDWPALLNGLEACGPVMALTRNAHCVHEKTGVYRDVEVGEHVGLVLDEQIDLRLFFARWRHALAVDVKAAKGRIMRSIQIFDADGAAVHKIYVRPQTDEARWDALLASLTHADQSPWQHVEPTRTPEAELADDVVDVATFQREWLDLQDTHEFFGLTRRHKLTRTQALRLAPEGHATRVAASAPSRLLTLAAERGVPVMVFVGSVGVVQIHTGPVKKIVPMEGWFNVMDPGFNLHLHESGVTDCWIVRKPTADGVVTSLEAFDATGMLVVQLFGQRKPGVPEREDWRTLLDAAFGA